VLEHAMATDATNFNETFAGRRIFGGRYCFGSSAEVNCTSRSPVEVGIVPLIERICDHTEEHEDSSMAASPAIPLRMYAAKNASRQVNASWLLVGPPNGYNRSMYDKLTFGLGPHNGRGVFRFEGNARYLSIPEWYYREVARMPSSSLSAHAERVPAIAAGQPQRRQHYLRNCSSHLGREAGR